MRRWNTAFFNTDTFFYTECTFLVLDRTFYEKTQNEIGNLIILKIILSEK